MDFFLATSCGDPIENRESEQTICTHIHINRNQKLYRTASGTWVQDVRTQMDNEQ